MPDWRAQEARRALHESSRLLALAQQTMRVAPAEGETRSVGNLERAIVQSLAEDQEVARLISRVPRPHAGLRLGT